MKKLFLLPLLLVTASPAALAQIDLSANYAYARPQQKMGNFIREAHGMHIQGLYLIPNTRFAIGADIGYNLYGSKTSRQTYRFSDGTTTETDVEVSSNFLTFNLVGRADLRTSGVLIPYIVGQTGYNHYYTSLYIENPDDPDGCHPLENKSLLKDGTFSVTGGAGLRWDLGSVFKGAGKNRFYMDFSGHYTQGGSVSYMNVNIAPDPDPVAHQHRTTTPQGDVTPFHTQFVNPSNRVVHEHHVGDIYTSPIQLMTFKLAFIYRVNH